MLMRILMLMARSSAWSPASLFAAGEQGIWLDPSDFSTMFQDAAGTTPVTAVEQPVGLILDKSGRGNHARQATVAKRPVLKQDVGGQYYLKFDGIDDALYTSSIDFTSTDKMTVVAGVRKLGTSQSILFALTANAPYYGRFDIQAPSPTANYLFESGGTIITKSSSISASYKSPVTNVVTGIADIANAINTLRVNGSQVETTTTTQGTGTYLKWPLYIGANNGTNLFFTGNLYSLIIRGTQSSEAQILSAETYCNQKTGAWA